MSIKTILVPLTDLLRARTTLETAFVVAQRFGSHVVGVRTRAAFEDDNVEVIMELASLGRSNPLVQEINPTRIEDEDTERARQLFEDTCHDMNVQIRDNQRYLQDVSATFKLIIGEGPEAIAETARVFDLVVAGQPKDDLGHSLRETLRAILFHSGRPVLVAPAQGSTSVGESILISWNRSALSARAAAISRQFFERAKKVGILSVHAEEGLGPPQEELQEYLAWHGIYAELLEAKRNHRHLGDVILDQATAFGADLLVMGAYSQSPFRESLTRGVTNHVLSYAELPILMTH